MDNKYNINDRVNVLTFSYPVTVVGIQKSGLGDSYGYFYNVSVYGGKVVQRIPEEWITERVDERSIQ